MFAPGDAAGYRGGRRTDVRPRTGHGGSRRGGDQRRPDGGDPEREAAADPGFHRRLPARAGYPPSVREIGEAVGLTSSATVHTHLAVLQREGYLSRDPSKPRAIQVHWDPATSAPINAAAVRNVPLVGDVAAGTGVLAEENVEELLPMPEQFTGTGPSFMLRVRGDSMVDAGIYDGDYVVVRQQPVADNGDVVVAGIPGGEATVKTFARKGDKVVLVPANSAYEPMVFDGADDVTIFGKVVTVVRQLNCMPRRLGS